MWKGRREFKTRNEERKKKIANMYWFGNKVPGILEFRDSLGTKFNCDA